jgi:hypothetical protein
MDVFHDPGASGKTGTASGRKRGEEEDEYRSSYNSLGVFSEDLSVMNRTYQHPDLIDNEKKENELGRTLKLMTEMIPRSQRSGTFDDGADEERI